MENNKIFISYSRNDLDFAAKLATELKNAGADVWLDKLDIRLAEKWDVEIENALESCKSLFFIVSKSSIASDNVLNEVYYVMEEGKKVYPIIKEEVKLPFRLSRLQYVDLSSNYENGLNQLLTALNLPGKASSVNQNISPQPSSLISDNTIRQKSDVSAAPDIPHQPSSDRNTLAPQKTSNEENVPSVNKAETGKNRKKVLIGGGILALLILVILLSTSSSKNNNIADNSTDSTSTVAADNTLDSATIAAMYDSAKTYDSNGYFDSSFNIYMKLAKFGYADAMDSLGNAYYFGQGTGSSLASSFDWYSKAAEKGDAYGMYSLAYCYNNGQGVKENQDSATAWYQKAAEGGNADAKEELRKRTAAGSQ